MFQVSGVPAGMPSPHWFGPLPADSQVVVPPGTTFQPWSVSSFLAAAMSNGNGLVVALAGVKSFFGTAGTGPYDGAAALRKTPLISAGWSCRCASAWRMYSCLMIELNEPVVFLKLNSMYSNPKAGYP